MSNGKAILICPICGDLVNHLNCTLEEADVEHRLVCEHGSMHGHLKDYESVAGFVVEIGGTPCTHCRDGY